MNLDMYLKDGCEIYRQSTNTSEIGETVKVFTLISTVKGLMRQLQGDEVIASQKETERVTNRFYCYPTDIKVGDQIRYLDGEHYDVMRVNDVMDRGDFLQVDCRVRI